MSLRLTCLWQAELRFVGLALGSDQGSHTSYAPAASGGWGGIRTLVDLLDLTRFPSERIRPLCHPSIYARRDSAWNGQRRKRGVRFLAKTGS
jgi:hypothetical protein